MYNLENVYGRRVEYYDVELEVLRYISELKFFSEEEAATKKANLTEGLPAIKQFKDTFITALSSYKTNSTSANLNTLKEVMVTRLNNNSKTLVTNYSETLALEKFDELVKSGDDLYGRRKTYINAKTAEDNANAAIAQQLQKTYPEDATGKAAFDAKVEELEAAYNAAKATKEAALTNLKDAIYIKLCNENQASINALDNEKLLKEANRVAEQLINDVASAEEELASYSNRKAWLESKLREHGAWLIAMQGTGELPNSSELPEGQKNGVNLGQSGNGTPYLYVTGKVISAYTFASDNTPTLIDFDYVDTDIANRYPKQDIVDDNGNPTGEEISSEDVYKQAMEDIVSGKRALDDSVKINTVKNIRGL